MLKQVRIVGLCLALAGVMGGCQGIGAASTGERQETSPSVSVSQDAEDEPKVFYGTDQEWLDASIACVERHGLSAVRGDPNDFVSFGVSAEGVGMERVDEVLEACHVEVGELYEPPATEASVTAEYEWLLGQYRCLVAAGFTMEPAPSLETVLDEWRAKGYGSFDPVGMAGNYGAALAACPRSTEEWPK